MKMPYFPFYPGDWMKDPALSMCTPATRGIWIDLICAMHELDRMGEVRGTLQALSQTCRCTAAAMKVSLKELDRTKTAIVNYCNGEVTVICRRMQRAYIERDETRKRVQKHRCNGDVTPDVTHLKRQKAPPGNRTISDSVSDSVSEEETHTESAPEWPTQAEWRAAAEMEGMSQDFIDLEWCNQERKPPESRWKGVDRTRLRAHARAVIGFARMRGQLKPAKTVSGGVGVAFAAEKVTQTSKQL